MNWFSQKINSSDIDNQNRVPNYTTSPPPPPPPPHPSLFSLSLSRSLVVASVRDVSVTVQFVTLDLIERIQLVGIYILVRGLQILCLIEIHEIWGDFRLDLMWTILHHDWVFTSVVVVHGDLSVAIEFLVSWSVVVLFSEKQFDIENMKFQYNTSY